MVDLEILKQRGITPESLRRRLSIDPLSIPKDGPPSTIGDVSPDASEEAKAEAKEKSKAAALMFRIRSRIQEGMNRCFENYKTYHAIDLAWETPHRQITPTLVQQFISQDPNQEAVYKQISDWGLTTLIEEKPDAKTGKLIKTFNFPTFFQVFVPLVKSYVTIRWAKIMNDRRLTPFLKFEAVKMTSALRLRCEALTDRIQIISNQYGYFDTLKQVVLKMLAYGVALMFPKEEWHRVEQWKQADATDVALGKTNAAGESVKEGDEIKVTEREGLRYHLPHPTRMYWDIAHGATTMNYNSGCEYAGYWRVVRYREIENNKAFWNTDRVALGSVDFMSGNRAFFASVYSACTLTIPTLSQPKQPEGGAATSSLGLGAGDLDREKHLANLYYGTEHGDQGVLVTEHWEYLIPKDNGLGDYDCPVWFRFVVAGDLATILYAAPVPYNPLLQAGYDADDSRIKNSSLAQEILPFQDHFGNVLTQMILTAKQNLANLTFVDQDQIDEDTVKKVQNIGEGYFRFLNIFGYSSKRAARLQTKIPEAVQSTNFPKGSVQELISVLRSLLDILERVLVMSSNEVGQAASHEQTREEIRNIMANTSSRLVFTATPIDILRDAWKRQLFEALMSYGDDDMWARIPFETPLTKEVLTAMGFTYVDRDVLPGDRYLNVRFKKRATAINIWELASTRDGDDRQNDAQTAQVMAQLVMQMLGNPLTAQAIGAAQAIELANAIGQMAGLPRDFKLRDMTPQASPEEQQVQAQAMLKEVAETVMAMVTKEMQPTIQAVSEHSAEIAMLMEKANLQPPNEPTDRTVAAAGA